MKRDYESGVDTDVIFFIGNEIEHTPAYGLKTLFVVGVQSVESINTLAEKEDIKHIFFGANHSFNPKGGHREWKQWEDLIQHFLDLGFLCSLDIPIAEAGAFTSLSPLLSYNNFIPQLRVPVPDIRKWNYNTMLKIDDMGFKASNPGVWTHSLHDLQDRSKFTPWHQYSNDVVIKTND